MTQLLQVAVRANLFEVTNVILNFDPKNFRHEGTLEFFRGFLSVVSSKLQNVPKEKRHEVLEYFGKNFGQFGTVDLNGVKYYE